jgi:hypothetical protein
MRVDNRYHLVLDRGLLSRNLTSLGKKAEKTWKEDVKLRGGKEEGNQKICFHEHNIGHSFLKASSSPP